MARVLLFGRSLLRNHRQFDQVCQLASEQSGSQVDAFPYPTGKPLPKLDSYRLVILPYSPFSGVIGDHTREKQQAIFVEKMDLALAAGTSFCFLHYDEYVPGFSAGSTSTGNMDPKEVELCRRRQVGFYWLSISSIAVFRRDARDRPFKFAGAAPETLKRSMHSYLGFAPFLMGRFDQVLSEDSGVVNTFVLKREKGKLIYLPFMLPSDIETLVQLVCWAVSFGSI